MMVFNKMYFIDLKYVQDKQPQTTSLTYSTKTHLTAETVVKTNKNTLAKS